MDEIVARVRVDFCLIGDSFDLERVNKELGLTPDECWRKGEQVRDKPIFRKDTTWCISTGYQASLEVSTQINSILDQIEDKKMALLQLKQEYELNFVFPMVVEVEDGQKPAMIFDTRFIRFLSDIGAEFYIDLYVYESELEG